MSAKQQQVLYGLLAFMLAVDVLPAAAAAVAALLGNLKGDSTAGQLFLALIVTPSGFVPILQKFLVPLTAGLSTAVLWSEKFATKVIVLLGIAGIGVISTIFLFLYLSIENNAQELWQLANLSAVQSAEMFEPLKDHYLSGTLESLLGYIAVVVGLQAIPSKR